MKSYFAKGALIAAVALLGCRADGDYPGMEYAPQMYHSVAYEPMSQITEEDIPSGPISSWYYLTTSTPYNDYKGKFAQNMRQPVAGTVARQNYTAVTGQAVTSPNQPILHYSIHKDSLDIAAARLKSPLADKPEYVEQGKALYTSYCQPCHGEQGDGQGKVGKVYKGVANLKSKTITGVTDGHIFHVVTNGKGRMWGLKSQVNPEQRWMIVKYVRSLQGLTPGAAPAAADSTAAAPADATAKN